MRTFLAPGQLVRSKAGRDSGKYFLVIENGRGTVRVADGRVRKVQSPKKKNVRHLEVYDLVAEELAQKLCAGQKITNGEVEKAVKNLVISREG